MLLEHVKNVSPFTTDIFRNMTEPDGICNKSASNGESRLVSILLKAINTKRKCTVLFIDYSGK